jgi:thiaminase
LLTSSRLVRTIREGRITPALYAAYLLETYHYTRHNAKNQALAGVVAASVDPRYMQFCFTHASEETGHELMALHDMRGVGAELDPIPPPLPATEVLIAYLYWISATGDPVQRLGYSFWAETSYAYIMPIIRQVQETLGLKPAQMTFFLSHAQIDEAHAAEVRRMIVEHCRTERQWEAVASVMEASLDLTGRMMDAVMSEYLKLIEGRSGRYAPLRDLLGEPWPRTSKD